MSTEVNSENFFFIAQKFFLAKLLYIRHTNLKFLFVLFTDQIKKAHLPHQTVLSFLADVICNLLINHHLLTAITFQTVQCPGFDKVLYCTFIHLLCVSLHEILQGTIQSVLFTFTYQTLDNRTAYTFDCRQSVSDRTIVYRETIHSAIDIRRQDFDSHLTAYQEILCYLCRKINN